MERQIVIFHTRSRPSQQGTWDFCSTLRNSAMLKSWENRREYELLVHVIGFPGSHVFFQNYSNFRTTSTSRMYWFQSLAQLEIHEKLKNMCGVVKFLFLNANALICRRTTLDFDIWVFLLCFWRIVLPCSVCFCLFCVCFALLCSFVFPCVVGGFVCGGLVYVAFFWLFWFVFPGKH